MSSLIHDLTKPLARSIAFDLGRSERRHGDAVPSGGNGLMDFSDSDASGLLALLEDI